jgi:uncharacterized membrane protein YfcA
MTRLPASTLRKTGWAVAAITLLAAAIGTLAGAMNWGPEDFLAAALLLGGAAVGVELALRLPRRLRLPVAGLVLAAMLLIWAELAVGIWH